jgi:hypothetical protein
VWRGAGRSAADAAGADPADNWLDTCGHEFGAMCWRWIRAVEHPQPTTRVVKLDQLKTDRR